MPAISDDQVEHRRASGCRNASPEGRLGRRLMGHPLDVVAPDGESAEPDARGPTMNGIRQP